MNTKHLHNEKHTFTNRRRKHDSGSHWIFIGPKKPNEEANVIAANNSQLQKLLQLIESTLKTVATSWKCVSAIASPIRFLALVRVKRIKLHPSIFTQNSCFSSATKRTTMATQLKHKNHFTQNWRRSTGIYKQVPSPSHKWYHTNARSLLSGAPKNAAISAQILEFYVQSHWNGPETCSLQKHWHKFHDGARCSSFLCTKTLAYMNTKPFFLHKNYVLYTLMWPLQTALWLKQARKTDHHQSSFLFCRRNLSYFRQKSRKKRQKLCDFK